MFTGTYLYSPGTVNILDFVNPALPSEPKRLNTTTGEKGNHLDWIMDLFVRHSSCVFLSMLILVFLFKSQALPAMRKQLLKIERKTTAIVG